MKLRSRRNLGFGKIPKVPFVASVSKLKEFLHVLLTRVLSLMSMTLESRDLIGGNGLRNVGGHVTVQHASLVSA